jgi:hypothetical protein
MVDGKPGGLAIDFGWLAGMLVPEGSAPASLVIKPKERHHPGTSLVL